MFVYLTEFIVLLAAVEALPGRFYTSPDANVQCTSYGGLCDMSYGFGDPAMMVPSSGHMCACPGNVTCPRDEDDPSRVINLKLLGESQMSIRLSYCEVKGADLRQCQFGELAVTLEGGSPFAMTVVGNIRCSCSEALTPDSAKPDGAYTVQTFTCGKKTCNINKSTPPTCERQRSVLTLNGFQTSTDVPCVCPAGFVCSGTSPGISLRPIFGGLEEKTCEVTRNRW